MAMFNQQLLQIMQETKLKRTNMEMLRIPIPGIMPEILLKKTNMGIQQEPIKKTTQEIGYYMNRLINQKKREETSLVKGEKSDCKWCSIGLLPKNIPEIACPNL